MRHYVRDAKIPVCHDFFLSFCFFVCFAFYREILPLLWFIYSSHRRCSLRKDALRNFAKFTGKHLCLSLFLNKGAGRGLHWVSFLIKLQAESCNFIEKEPLAQVFSCEFCEISKNTFFTEYLFYRIPLGDFFCIYNSSLYSEGLPKRLSFYLNSCINDTPRFLKVVNYFRKNLHLRCLAGSWIHLSAEFSLISLAIKK